MFIYLRTPILQLHQPEGVDKEREKRKKKETPEM